MWNWDSPVSVVSLQRQYIAFLLRNLVTYSLLFFFLNFKGTPLKEEHKSIFSSLKICQMALSNQIDFPAFFNLRKMTYRNFINFGIRQSAIAFVL
jgi:hypothetical protein